VVEALRADGVGDRDGVARAVDVDPDLLLGARLEIVDGSEVEEMIDLAFELAEVGLGDAESRLDEIALDRQGAGLVDAPVLERLRHFRSGLVASEEIDDGALAREDLLDETLADEARGAGDEIMHRSSFVGSGCRLVLACGSHRPGGGAMITS